MRHTRVDLRKGAGGCRQPTRPCATTWFTPGLDPRVHHSSQGLSAKRMDCRVKPGNDQMGKNDRSALKCRARAKPELGQHDNDTTLASHIFRLTRVTRIFQKSVFTETTPGRPGGRPRRVFCCAGATRPRTAYSFAS